MDKKIVTKPTPIIVSAAASAVLAGLLAAGCATSAVFWDGHRAYPKKPRFSIVPREYSREELAAAGIRTDGVFVRTGWRPQELQEREEAMLKEKGWRAGSPFHRFWANGRMIYRLADVEDMAASDSDSFERARMGYFRIASNGFIEMEVFAYAPGKGDYDYVRTMFKIEGDTMWLDYGYGYKHKGETVQLGYRFVPLPGMKAQPDW